MTDFAHHRETWRAAIEILVSREVANSNAQNPGAYAGSVRSRLLNDTRDHARALLEHDATLTAEQLAAALDDTPTPAPSGSPYVQRTPSVPHYDRRSACTTCGCYGGDGWLPAPNRDHLGITADLEPCPTCAIDRVRDVHHHSRPGDRADMHRRYAQAITHHRTKHGTEPEPVAELEAPATEDQPAPTHQHEDAFA